MTNSKVQVVVLSFEIVFESQLNGVIFTTLVHYN